MVGSATLVGLVVAGAAVASILPSSEWHVQRSVALKPSEQFATSSSWLMCPSPEACGKQQMQAWRTPPATLAASIGANLESLPGVAKHTYDSVAQHWNAAPPAFKNQQVTLGAIAAFMRDVLSSDPFGTGVQVPYVDFHGGGEKIVAITQRQIAFLAANALMGNSIPVGDGLSEALRRCSGKGNPDTIFSLLSLLAILSRELVGGSQGSMIIGATPAANDNSWAERLQDKTLNHPTVCQEIGAGSNPSCGKPDFMSGGAYGQAMVDIAGTVVGGGSQLCGLANSQDESLVQFYAEVLAFAFFVGSGHPKMLPVPMVLLGTRVYLSAISGESTSTGGPTCGKISASNWLNNNIQAAKIQVPLNGQTVTVAASAFVAVASKSSAAYGGCPIGKLMNNNCDIQRRHLMDDVALWYRAFEPEMYPVAVREAVQGAIKSVGTGPWGAGVWFGDSQQYFLAVWLATSLLSNGATLDYYLYDHFCENPGNQCFVLGSQGCAACVAKAQVQNINAGRCGAASIQDMITEFTGKPALALFNALKSVGAPPAQVFDLLKGEAANVGTMLDPPPYFPPPRPKAEQQGGGVTILPAPGAAAAGRPLPAFPAAPAVAGRAPAPAQAGGTPAATGAPAAGSLPAVPINVPTLAPLAGAPAAAAAAASSPPAGAVDVRSTAVKAIAVVVLIVGLGFLAVGTVQSFTKPNFHGVTHAGEPAMHSNVATNGFAQTQQQAPFAQMSTQQPIAGL